MQKSGINVGRIDVGGVELRAALGLVPDPEILIHAAVESGNPRQEDGLVGDVDNLELAV